jgi:2,4-dienoyl-CoA reductase-like NADH-dependent reductase (Old Yellow Enzyme family)
MEQNSIKKKIFEPLKLNNLTLRNRLLRSATWEGIASKMVLLMKKYIQYMKNYLKEE